MLRHAAAARAAEAINREAGANGVLALGGDVAKPVGCQIAVGKVTDFASRSQLIWCDGPPSPISVNGAQNIGWA